MPMLNASLKKEAPQTGGDRQDLLPKTPAHQAVYARMRDAILFGDLAPGQPITIQGLTTMLNAGMTPVREAIRKLTAEGALEMQGNRRASVPVLDLHTLAVKSGTRAGISRHRAHRQRRY